MRSIAFLVLSLFCLASCEAHLPKEGLKPGQSGYTTSLGSKACGQSGFYSQATAVYAVFVGYSGDLHCIIRVTDELIAHSDVSKGYVCVFPGQAKPARYVSKNDPSVMRERNYEKTIAEAQAFADQHKLPLRVVYVQTNQGPPHAEPACRLS